MGDDDGGEDIERNAGLYELVFGHPLRNFDRSLELPMPDHL